jgi:general secretion pathway protein N
MVNWPKILGLALLSGGMLVIASAPHSQAATSATLDILPSDRAGEVPDTVDLGSVKPIARPNREAAKPRPSGNPLWSIPLSVLTATQERPIFSASRRPPQRAVVAPPVAEVSVPAPAKPAEPERIALALIGAVVGDSDAIAVFLDRTSQKIVRLRQGESHDGWQLSSVQRREVTFKKNDRTEVLALQRQEVPAGIPGVPAGIPGVPASIPGVSAGIPGLPTIVPAAVPAAGGATYIPFILRSTPKNGESDGL